MKFHFCKDNQTMVQLENFWCQDKIREFQAQSIYLPAGQTPIPLYNYWEKTRPSFLNHLKFFQVDDILEGEKKNLFQNFFKDQLPTYFDQIISPQTMGPVQADLGILGLGKNGHVAFHEPHLPRDFDFGEVELAQMSAENLGVITGTRAISYGLGSFVKCKAILLIVTGPGKEDAFNSFINEIDDQPVNELKKHCDLTVISELSIENFKFKNELCFQ